MKKIITKQIEVEVCDNCGKEQSLAYDILLQKCGICEKSICHNCGVEIRSIKRVNNICVAHLPKDVVEFLNRD